MSLSAEDTVTVLFSINILDLQNQFSFYEYCELEIRSWYYKKISEMLLIVSRGTLQWRLYFSMTSKTFKYWGAIFSHSGSYNALNECVSERATNKVWYYEKT